MTLQIDAPRPDNARASTAGAQRVVMTVDAVGGVWRYAIDLANSLQARGARIALVGFGPAPTQTQRAEAEATRVSLTWSELPLDWMPGGMNVLAAARAQIARAATLFKADVAHVNSLAYAGPEISRPIVAVAHSCVPTWWRCVHGEDAPADWRAHRRANWAGLRASACILAPSQSHADNLRAEYGGDLDIRVVYNASRETPAPSRRREAFVFAAGRWWDEAKNARTLDAAAALTRWPVLMAGSLQDPAGRRMAIAHARALGALDAGAAREWMRRASVFAAPSLYEPFGLAVLEAARASTPLVLADITTFRELWDEAALFACPREPAAFASAIDRLMSDARLRRRLGRRARERAMGFTLDSQANAVTSAYRDALNAPSAENLRSAV